MLTYTTHKSFDSLHVSATRCDVWRCEINEKEATRPRLTIVVGADVAESIDIHQWIHVQRRHVTTDEVGESTLFVGRVVTQKHLNTENCIEIHAICDHPDNPRIVRDHLALRVETNNHAPHMYGSDDATLSQILNATLDLPGWDRTTGMFHLSHLFEGLRSHALCVNDSLAITQQKMVRKPLKSVNVQVTCQWDYERIKTTRICDDGFVIHTLTPDEFTHGWPQVGTYIKGTNLRVVHSDIRSEARPETVFTPWVSPQTGQRIHYPLTIHHLRPELEVEERRTTTLTERFTCTLENSYQTSSPTDPTKNITVNLGKIDVTEAICPWQPHTYYENGQIMCDDGLYYLATVSHKSTEAIDYALWSRVPADVVFRRMQSRKSCFVHDAASRMLRHLSATARGYLANSTRCIKTNLALTLAKGMDYRTLDGISYTGGGDVSSDFTGKITEVHMVITPDQQRVYATILSSIGTEEVVADEAHAASEDYLEEETPYAGNLTIGENSDVPDLCINMLAEPIPELARYTIEGVSFDNLYEDQLRFLGVTIRKNGARDAFCKVPSTRAKLNFSESLTAKSATLKHKATFAHAWSAPQQFVMGGSLDDEA